jgi:hypothetical protein
MRLRPFTFLFAALTLLRPAAAMTEQERREYLDQLLKILPNAPQFKQWLDKAGELPPDFDAFPRVNGLPDPLKFLDGRPVRNATEWKARRQEIGQLYQKYDLGTFPPKPSFDRVVPLDETRGQGYLIRNVRLEFGPEGKGSMRVQVMIPDGKGPFPVLISPNLAGWGPALLRRGYISCGYAANDGMDDAAALGQLYPDYDFALLPRRAWAAGLVLDYLETLPAVDKKHIAMFGYSRDGKMAAIATAFDERIAAVIAGSTGVGGVLPWRLSGERNFGEGPPRRSAAHLAVWVLEGLYATGLEARVKGVVSIAGFTPMRTDAMARGTGGVARYSQEHGLIPRLGFFVGREDRIPYDFDELIATIAPRPVLVVGPQLDRDATPADVHSAVNVAKRIYDLYGAAEKLATQEPWDYNRLPDRTQDEIVKWMDATLR